MRSDISKVLVTTPRFGSRLKNGEVLALRRERITEDYDGPRRTSMKPSHHRYCDRKQLNEYLNPLRRYLQRKIGERWDDVYSDICENNSRGSAVGEHIFQHLFDYVQVNVTAESKWEMWDFFVDGDGILRKSPERERWRRPAPPDTWISTDDENLWYVQRDDGCWFEWRLIPYPEEYFERWKVTNREIKNFGQGLPSALGRYGVLRTLSKADKKALGI